MKFLLTYKLIIKIVRLLVRSLDTISDSNLLHKACYGKQDLQINKLYGPVIGIII